MSVEAREADIYIVGTGIKSVDHITNEVEMIISTAKKVLYVDNGVGVREYLESKCNDIVDLLSPSYVENESRMKAYHNMAASVIDAALAEPPVVFALYGHPLVFALPPILIREVAPLFDLRVKVLPAISAFDCLLSDLFVDPCGKGLQMFEATDLVLRQHPLNVNISTMIWQLGSLETALYTTRKSTERRFDRLDDHLRRFFPGSHKAYCVYSSAHPLSNSQIVEIPLNELRGSGPDIHGGFTMFIPPLKTGMVVERELAELVYSIEHLESISEQR